MFKGRRVPVVQRRRVAADNGHGTGTPGNGISVKHALGPAAGAVQGVRHVLGQRSGRLPADDDPSRTLATPRRQPTARRSLVGRFRRFTV